MRNQFPKNKKLILLTVLSVFTLTLLYFVYEKINDFITASKRTDIFINDQIRENQTINQQSKDIKQQERKDEQPKKTYNSYSLRDQRHDNNVTINPDGTKHYRNERYGLEFDFPSEWIAREPAFGSVNMEFNMELYIPDKAGLHPINIDAFPKSNGWIDRLQAYHKSTGEDKEYKKITISGIDGYTYMSTADGMPNIINLFSLGDYWIMILGKTKYKDTLDIVLNSAKFFTPNYEIK